MKRNLVYTIIIPILVISVFLPSIVVGRISEASSSGILHRKADFNGDGYDDLAVGVGGEGVGSADDAGAVNVLYGSSSGLSFVGNQLWHQNSPGILDECEGNDRFGEALATGDFDGNGYSDLAVGVGGEGVGSADDAGAVNVLYGYASGLSAAGNQMWHQNSPGILGICEEYDSFGEALATGDFDGNGYSDLAVGVAGEDFGSIGGAGAVNVLYGSSLGLSSVRNQMWHQNSPGILGICEGEDRFGYSVTTGDFNGDGYDDLVVGARSEGVGTHSSAGAVNVLYGSASGLSSEGNQLWHQNSPGVFGICENYDYFGTTLTSGDFNGDRYTDLAIGSNGEQIGPRDDAGAVNILYGSSSGLSSTGNQLWHQNSPGIPDVCESFDWFGWSLAAGDMNGDWCSDLAIGVPYESTGTNVNVGVVHILYGSVSGLSASGNQMWHQNSPGILGIGEGYDILGWAVTVGNFDGRGYDALAIGSVGENIGTNMNAGAVNVLYGSSSGLSATGNQIWHQNSPGILGFCEEYDVFGDTLA